MNKEFWIKRWDENKIGFNQAEVNPNLVKYFSSFNLEPSKKVFVPLCGKSIDMVFFADNDCNVIGNECSELAVSDFFKEQNILCDVQREEKFNIYSSESIKLYSGDFFSMKKKVLKDVGLVYDRASFVALDEQARKRYAAFLIERLSKDTKIFLITTLYDQSEMKGPPFSVSRDEVEELFSSAFKIKQMESRQILDENEKFRERGLTWFVEEVYILKKLED